jgi:hypothetical protein
MNRWTNVGEQIIRILSNFQVQCKTYSTYTLKNSNFQDKIYDTLKDKESVSEMSLESDKVAGLLQKICLDC